MIFINSKYMNKEIIQDVKNYNCLKMGEIESEYG